MKFHEIHPIPQIFFTYSEDGKLAPNTVPTRVDGPRNSPNFNQIPFPIAFFGAVSGGTAASTSAFTVVSGFFLRFLLPSSVAFQITDFLIVLT